MAIRFLCPNGHKINCPETHVGRTAKCPQCGVAFLVPAPPETQATRIEGDPGKSSPAASGAHPKGPQIEFLCPNGHRLHGPASLQGHPGQCPECGSRFRIPSYDDVSEEEQPEQNLGIGPANEAPADLAMDDDLASLTSFLDGEEAAQSAPQIQPPAVPAAVPEIQSVWAGLVADLWRQRGESAALEIRLTNGETLIPDRFAFAQSTHDYGLFSLKDSDGTFSVVAVAWDSVSRVELRGMKNVPKELFEPRSNGDRV